MIKGVILLEGVAPFKLNTKYTGMHNQIQYDIYNLPLWSAPFGIELLRNIDYFPNCKILDIGCGNGFPILELAQRFGKSSVLYGIDIDKEAIEKVKEIILAYNIKNIIIGHANAESIPFDNEYFDLIVSNNGINNVEDKEIVIKECSRVCKQGGELVFTFNMNTTFSHFYNLFKKILKEFSLEKEIELIDLHINEKRPSLETIKKHLLHFNFDIVNISNLEFEMSFVDGTTFFEHYFIKKWFLPEWEKIIPFENREIIFNRIGKELNMISKQGYLSYNVPYVCIKCKKINDNRK